MWAVWFVVEDWVRGVNWLRWAGALIASVFVWLVALHLFASGKMNAGAYDDQIVKDTAEGRPAVETAVELNRVFWGSPIDAAAVEARLKAIIAKADADLKATREEALRRAYERRRAYELAVSRGLLSDGEPAAGPRVIQTPHGPVTVRKVE